MEIVDTITGQQGVVRRPLICVTLTAARCPRTPLLLLLHWHGFVAAEVAAVGRSAGRQEAARNGPAPAVPVPCSALQVTLDWQDPSRVDGAMLEAAWRLGAWALVREEHRGSDTPGASPAETLACRQAFGDNPLLPHDTSHLVDEAPDRHVLRDLAARMGYLRWHFSPVRGGLWPGHDDRTLQADGGRPPHGPLPSQPHAVIRAGGEGRVIRTTYQLGLRVHSGAALAPPRVRISPQSRGS